MSGTTPTGPPRRPPAGGTLYPRVSERRPVEYVDLDATIKLLEQALVIARRWHGQETTQDPTEARVTRQRLGERNSDLLYIGQLAGAARAEAELEHLRLRGRPDPRRPE